MFMFTTVNVVKDKEIELGTHLLLDSKTHLHTSLLFFRIVQRLHLACWMLTVVQVKVFRYWPCPHNLERI